MMRVLALDLATTTGAAWNGPLDRHGQVRPVSTVLAFRAEPAQHRTVEADAFDRLARHVADTRPDCIVFERSLIFGGPRGSTRPTTSETIVRLISLIGVVSAVAGKFERPLMRASAQTVRKHFCGNGRATKDDVMRRCRALGWEPATHDAADACALWDWAINHLRAGQVTAGALFAAGAGAKPAGDDDDLLEIPAFLRRKGRAG